MAMTLYFAKMNINSHIYKVYEDRKVMKTIFDEIYENLTDGVEIEREKYFKKDGNQYLTIDTYKFAQLEKMIGNPDDRIIYGKILKESYKYLKQGIRKDGEFIVNKVPFLEENIFYFDIKNEIIVFNRTLNFGYKEFVNVFQELLNKSVNKMQAEDGLVFDISLYTKGIKIEDLKDELKKMGALEQLEIAIIPPNPNSNILDEMDQQGIFLEEMRLGNLNSYVVNLESVTSAGVNLDSPVVNRELQRANHIHKKLSEEEVTSKGYLKVRGRNRKGESFSTQDSRPVTREVSDDHRDKNTFIAKCLDYVMEILL